MRSLVVAASIACGIALAGEAHARTRRAADEPGAGGDVQGPRVGDDGTIVFALRTEDGVSYRTARCP